MKRLLLVAMGLLVAAACPGATHYVVTNNSVNPAGVDPYTTWETAGTNIIDVVKAAMTNTEPRLVVVSNGIYYLTNHVYVTNAMTIKSVNGCGETVVNGGYGVTTYGGCFCLAACGITLDGFTITNGAARDGGGIHIGTSNTVVQNCLITGMHSHQCR
ncbi:MAG: hypothetical protein PHP98_02630 [Kiritimatiellae bacterium]|nr:hypothetical protein [Kiritimatiellia bacterium]